MFSWYSKIEDDAKHVSFNWNKVNGDFMVITCPVEESQLIDIGNVSLVHIAHLPLFIYTAVGSTTSEETCILQFCFIDKLSAIKREDSQCILAPIMNLTLFNLQNKSLLDEHREKSDSLSNMYSVRP